jgi:hypothetical protein
MTTYRPFPTRTVEGSFGAHQLDAVTERFWKYLSKNVSLAFTSTNLTYHNTKPNATITRTTGNFVTDKWQLGQKAVISNTLHNSNNNKKVTIKTVHPLTLILDDPERLIDEGPVLSILSANETLRKTNYLDILNFGNTLSYREPYFILADVSDYANYSHRNISYASKNGRIRWNAGTPPVFTNRFVFTANPQLYTLPPLGVNYKLQLSTVEGINSNIFNVNSNPSPSTEIFIASMAFSTGPLNPSTGETDVMTNSTDNSYFQDYIAALMYDQNQGNIFNTDHALSGRGTISINLDFENVPNIMYKITINTLPVFIDWASLVLRYLTTGSFNPITDLTK